jgi:hypothetical protein
MFWNLVNPGYGPIALNEGGGFSPASLFAGGVVGAVYDPSDLSTLWQDSARTTPVTADGDPVGCIDDKSGNGNHATQPTGVRRPLYKTAGGLHWLEGDGVDDWLRSTFTIAQPIERVSAIRQISWTDTDQIFGGTTINGAALLQSGVSPSLSMFSGLSGPSSTAAIVGADAVITERFDDNNSRLAVNNGSYATGDADTRVPGGITIFAQNNNTAAANARCYGVTMRAGLLTDVQIASLRTYYAAKSGVTL